MARKPRDRSNLKPGAVGREIMAGRVRAVAEADSARDDGALIGALEDLERAAREWRLQVTKRTGGAKNLPRRG